MPGEGKKKGKGDENVGILIQARDTSELGDGDGWFI